jgi:hypothetical protein
MSKHVGEVRAYTDVMSYVHLFHFKTYYFKQNAWNK